MSTTELIQKTLASSTTDTGSDCDACPSVGLPILLTRIGVAPKAMPVFDLPAQAQAVLDGIGAPALGHARYTLRTMRAGFVYIRYQRADTGIWRWQCYMVSPSGLLREIPLSTQPVPTPSEPACNRKAHSINASIISLPEPEKIAKAYFAYSEHFWTKSVRDHWAKDPLPRFIEFSPQAWLGSQQQTGAIPVGEASGRIPEYGPKYVASYFKDNYFEFKPRTDGADFASLSDRMNMILPGKGAVLTLPDPIGCATDLNTWRMFELDRYKTYLADPEVAWKYSCATQIEGLREFIQVQTKAEVAAEKKRQQRRRGPYRTDAQRAESRTRKKWEDLEAHYDEAARSAFLKSYKNKRDAHLKKIEQIDPDYVAWMSATSLSLAMSDYDAHNIADGPGAIEVSSRLLAGGVLGKDSLEYWKQMAEKDALDVSNYAIGGILANQEQWRTAFKNADEQNIGQLLTDTGTHGKLFDMLSKAAESDDLGGVTRHANTIINETSAALLTTVTGAFSAVASDAARRATQGMTDAGQAASEAVEKATYELDRLQVKLGLAYAHLIADTSVVLIKIELTLDEWHRIAMHMLGEGLKDITREAGRNFAAMALGAQLRIPHDSPMAQRLIGFTFWISGKGHALVKNLADALGTTAEVLMGAGANATKALARGAAAGAESAAGAGTRIGQGAAKGAQAALRRLTVVGHNLAEGSQVLSRLPTQLAETRAVQSATRMTRSALTMAGSSEVRIASVALVFQLYGIKQAIDVYGKTDGWRHRDAAWALGSSAVGLTGASLELWGKAVQVARGAEATMVGISAATVIRVGGYFGVVTSAYDSYQGFVKASTFYKSGDYDASTLMGIAGLFGGVGAGVGAWGVYIGSSAFFGPVGILIACIALGVVFTYVAFLVKDTQVEIWLDRSKFGAHKRTEGAFKSAKQEREAMELLGSQLVVELEWHDTGVTFISEEDEISVTVKWPHDSRGTVMYGLVLHGKGRKVIGDPVIDGPLSDQTLAIPAALKGGNKGAPSLASSTDLMRLPSEHSYKREGGQSNGSGQIVVWDEVWKVSERFDKAELYLRYFPEEGNAAKYFDDVLEVAD
ncbi:T6SS effector BTH_I2691 family protein [Nitrogeniibacter aestuarii]|uniref:T6SS effector BTH_I2691 family protein n=1 Tax=Nitrogeniibacter aestuarii TaxID=2815343 RepID=UPI001E4B4CE5|nr:T6SS effector BTH_I2691 family protein [Nitrogeniibacter aestuarii]